MADAWEAPVFQAANNEPVTSDILFADEDFFKLFTYTPVEGNLESALKEPMSVVITKSLSEKLFGRKPAVGQTMKMNNTHLLTVRAVIEEPKANSCISFSAISSVRTRKLVLSNEGEFKEWGWCNYQTCLLLKKGTNPDETAKKITACFPKEFQKDYSNAKLIPLQQVYLSKLDIFGNKYLRHGDKRKIMILVLVAALVLMIALVNFINISSAQWLDKIKQTGVMKIMGAKPSTILFNVLSEAFLLFLMAFYCNHDRNSHRPVYSELHGCQIQSSIHLLSGLFNHFNCRGLFSEYSFQHHSRYEDFRLKCDRQPEKNSGGTCCESAVQWSSRYCSICNCHCIIGFYCPCAKASQFWE